MIDNIYNAAAAVLTGLMTFHNANTIKEDYNTPYKDCKVLGCEDGGTASKIRWGTKIGLDAVATATSALACVDSASGGHIRTKAVRALLGGFDSGSDLKEKCSNLMGDNSKEKASLVKENSSVSETSTLNKNSNVTDIGDNTRMEDETISISSANFDENSNTDELKPNDVQSDVKETEVSSDDSNISDSLSETSTDSKIEESSNEENS